MKRKLITTLFALLLAAAALAGCGGSATKDVPVDQVAAAVAAAIGKSDALAASDSTFLGRTKLTAQALGEHAVFLNVYGANIDEFGIFKAGTMDTKALKSAVEGYLDSYRASWMEEYMPEEKPKLTNAEIQVVGDYVMYCILSDGDKAAAFQALEQAVK